MTDEPPPTCGRCGEPVKGSEFSLTLAKEIPGTDSTNLQLCNRCTESFERWYRKRMKSLTRLAPVKDLSNPGGTNSDSRSERRRQSRLRKKKKTQLLRTLSVTALSILLFAFAFYWTWTILKSTSRPDE